MPAFCCLCDPGGIAQLVDAGWSSPVARQAHNLKVVGSNPTPATITKPASQGIGGLFCVRFPACRKRRRDPTLRE